MTGFAAGKLNKLKYKNLPLRYLCVNFRANFVEDKTFQYDQLQNLPKRRMQYLMQTGSKSLWRKLLCRKPLL